MIQYQAAGKEDLPAISDSFQKAFPEALFAVFGNGRLPPTVVTDLFKGIYQLEPAGFIVARDGGVIVGYVMVCADREDLWRHLILGGTLWHMVSRWMTGRYPGLGVRFLPRLAKLGWDYWRAEKTPGAAETHMAQVLSVVVDQSRRREGIGRRLTELSLDYLRKTSAKQVRLEVDAAKEGPIQLYRKAGFQEISRLPTPRGPALVMTLSLR